MITLNIPHNNGEPANVNVQELSSYTVDTESVDINSAANYPSSIPVADSVITKRACSNCGKEPYFRALAHFRKLCFEFVAFYFNIFFRDILRNIHTVIEKIVQCFL